MNRSISILLIAILSLGAMGQINSVSANFSVTVYIQDAWYTDLDNDGSEDDIGVDLIINLCNNYVYTDVDFYVGLELPNDYEFWFKTSFTVKKYTYCEANGAIFYLYNTALVPGWYKAHAVGFAEGDNFARMDTLVFDPPGSNGGNPSATVTFYNVS